MKARLAITCLVLALVLCLAGVSAKPPPEDGTKALELGKGDRIIARHSGGVSGLAFSPDGKLLATAGGDKVIRLIDLATDKEVHRLEGHTGFIRTVAFSADGKMLVSAGDGESAIVWDVASGKEVRRIGKHANGLRMAAFSPDGKTLVTSAFDEHIGLWEVATGNKLHFYRAHPRVPYGVAFSPDGKLLASGGDNEGTIRLWDVASARQLRHWEGHQGCVYTVAFSPDGRLLASGGGDTVVRLWEVATGKEVRRLEGHSESVNKLAFSADGRTLIVGSHVETAHLWEVVSGKEIRRFGKHNGWVWGVACSPNGRVVASAGRDGMAVIWNLGSATAVARKPMELSGDAIDDAWRDLAGADAARAFEASLALSAAPAAQVMPFLRQRLRPAALVQVDVEKLQRLIRDLDDRSFKVRERAEVELAKLGDQAAGAIRAALAGTPSLDARRRLETLLARLDEQEVPPERLRALRALRVLEEHDTPESRQLLKDLAGGLAGDPLTLEAAVVRARMPKRQPNAP